VVDRVITGGQSGADLGAWNSARNAGRRAAGEMPSGFLTEDGPRPEYAVIYGATAGATDAYPERTRANVAASDAALIFDATPWPDRSPGTLCALAAADRERARRGSYPALVVACVARGKVVVPHVRAPTREDVAARVAGHRPAALFVGGNRESKAPGMARFVEYFLDDVFRLLAKDGPR
jgi:hypothetical protein